MGKISKTWKKIKKGVKKGYKKSIKPITSAVVGAAVGFVIGGPAGAVVGAVGSVAVSLQHNDSVAVATPNMPLYSVPRPPDPPSKKVNNTTPNKEDDFELMVKKEEAKPSSQPVQIIPHVEINPPNKLVPLFPEDEKPKQHSKILVWIGKILDGGVKLKERYDEAVHGPSGPRYELSSDDSEALKLLKSRANNLLDDIETTVGEDPTTDIFRGIELKNVNEKINELERKKVCCPACNGARYIKEICDNSDGNCRNCNGNGFAMKSCNHCMGAGFIQIN